jgi:tetratricopeptide (TPR) repeat protein
VSNDQVAELFQRARQLHQQGRLAEARSSYDEVLKREPDHAEALHLLGVTCFQAGQAEAGVTLVRRAIALNPNAAGPHANLGLALHDLGRTEEAVDSFRRAAELLPNHAGARYNLGAVLKELRRLDHAVAEFDAAIALSPRHVSAVYSRGVALAELGRADEALAAFDQAIALKPDYTEAIYARALSRLQVGDFDRGLRDYEVRKRLTPPLGHRPYAEPEWLGDGDITGKTLLLHHEQGFGDTLLFGRYARLAEARGAEVVLSVQTPLKRLMASLSPTIRVIGEGERPDRFDLHAPLMSLPLAFGTTVETIPSTSRYLASDQPLGARWAGRLPATRRRRIGLVWASNRENLQLTQRSVGLEAMLPLLAADADWISLQKDPAPGETAAFEAAGGVHLGDQLEDFADTAALLDLMDLVITVDTSVAHLAGALGRPVYILLAFNPDWRWFTGRADSPWYPSARLFRQPAPGDWATVIAEVKAALEP